MVERERDHERAEAEKEVRVNLKLGGYGYAEFYDEMVAVGLHVSLHADEHSYTVEVADSSDVIVCARMSRYSQRALDRAARQVRAQLQVEGEIEEWHRGRAA